MRVSTAVQRQIGLGQSVTHKEQLAYINIRLGEDAERLDWIINPRKTMFPWLTLIANAYDMYQFTNLKFSYVPDCPTTTTGSLVMYVDYDPTDDNSTVPYTDLMSMAGAVSDSIYKNISLKFDLRRLHDANHSYFCKGGGEPDRFNDIGRLWLRTKGPVEVLAVGRLMVEYTVKFKDPEVPAPVMTSSVYSKLKSAAPEVLATVSNNNPIGEAVASKVTGQVLDQLINEAATKIGIPNLCKNGMCYTPTRTTGELEGMPIPQTVVMHQMTAVSPVDPFVPGDDIVMDLTVDDGLTYYVVFNPSEYVDISALVCATLNARSATLPICHTYHNDGWEPVGTSHRFSVTPNVAVIGRQPLVAMLEYSLHRKPDGPQYLIFRFGIEADGVLGASTSTDVNASYPYSQIRFQNAAPSSTTPY
jgi:hypothetical protein